MSLNININSNQIYNVDALKFIKLMKKDNIKVDLIITDPPYNISRENNFQTIGRQGIDFGKWDHNFDQTSWIEEIKNIIKNTGSILIFNDWKNMGEISKALEKNGFHIKDLISWKKTNPMPRNVNSRYVSDREFCLWATKSNKWTFNKPKDLKYLRPELTDSNPLGSKRIHPTQKSLKIAKELIEIHSKEGDLIFDPFSGSGTFSCAAVSLSRKSIACEIDKNYFKDSIEKLNESKDLKKSPLYYIGDKHKILTQYYDEIIPKNINTFYDLFGGGGSVISNVEAVKRVYNDINTPVCELLKLLKNTSFLEIDKSIKTIIEKYKLINASNKATENKENYNKFKKDFNSGKYCISYAMDLLTLIFFGFNSNIRFNSKGQFNIPVGKGYYSKERIQNLKKFGESLKEVEIKNKDFNEFLNTNFEENDFVYLDPPYLVTDAPYNSFWNDKKEVELYSFLDILNKKGVRWTLSNVLNKGKKSNELLKKWIKINNYEVKKIEKQYKNSNYQRKEAPVQEIIVKNW